MTTKRLSAAEFWKEYCLTEDSEMADKTLGERMLKFAEAYALSVQSRWIAVSERLPESGRRVLFLWKSETGLKRTSAGFWAKRFTVEEGGDMAEDTGEYCAEKDEYFVREGWIEDTWEGEYYYPVNGVTHWMPLPDAPEGDRS